MVYMYSIDEFKDNAGQEELSTCFRYLNDDEEVLQHIYKLTRMKETDDNEGRSFTNK